MAELKIFEEGEVIYAREINENFSALQKNNSDFTEEMERYLKEKIASIQSNVESVQQTLQNNITAVNTALTALKDSLLFAISPDYSKGQGVSNGATMTSYGWVVWNGGQIGDSSTAQLWINGVGVGYHSYYKYGDSYKTMFFVSSGDKITFTGGTSARFYPCKGLQEVNNG